MKNITFKTILVLSFSLFSLFLTAQGTAPDEDTGTNLSCTSEGRNATRTSSDLPNPVNVGTIDDRSCYADYKESNVYGETWGVYNITYNSNHLDTNGLQPRIERSLSRSNATSVGSYVRFTGTVRILEVGDTSGTSQDGSYIIQTKGKHTGGGGSADPAICLYLAKPVYGSDGSGNQVQVSFNLYREQINYRGGEGSGGRQIVFLTNIKKNVPTTFELKVGFRADPNNSSLKVHYSDAVIGGQAFNWNIPEPEKGTESGIRYGAYRVKGGRAQIRWANTTYQKVEATDNGGSTPSDDVYRLRNVATGKFLTDAGVGASPVTMTGSGEAQNTHWTFVQSGAYYNIDSETFGILRATGGNFSAGAYLVVSTSTGPPSTATDKTWTIHHNTTTNIYRFESRNNGRYLYEDVNGNVYNIAADETDQRSQWEAIPTSQSLSIRNSKFDVSPVKIYPNPSTGNFTLSFGNSTNVNVKIVDLLGKVVLEKQSQGQHIYIKNEGQFKPGVYIIVLVDDAKNAYHSKLIIR